MQTDRRTEKRVGIDSRQKTKVDSKRKSTGRDERDIQQVELVNKELADKEKTGSRKSRDRQRIEDRHIEHCR